MATKPTLINSVVRATHLLDALGDARSPQPAKKLARAVGIPLPTAYHLLRTLVHEGYVEHTNEGYALGDQAAALGRGAEPHRVRRVLRGLHDALHAAAYLSTYADGEALLTEVVDSPEAPRIDMWVAFDEAAHATALGKALLTSLPDDDRREFVARHTFADLTPHTLTSPRAFMAQIGRQVPFAVDREEYLLGVVCVAVQVPGRAQAVAVSVPAGRAEQVLARIDELHRTAGLVALAPS
ncbi:IclR family transcriptional regulator [Georgenia sp. Z1491]|uniref:IclR family transcriptional regulator n=1 Tax=Georgenia sp. Z1491 TaxID=3416707 RepID=UPI003CECA102